MRDYTPDEEMVREQYTQEQPPPIGTMAEKYAEFDRFLAKIKADALRDSVEYFEGIVGVGEFRVETRRDGRHWVDPDRAWESKVRSWTGSAITLTGSRRATHELGRADRVQPPLGATPRGNNHQAEAARRMTVLLDAMEALRSGDVIERAARALYAEDVNESMDTPWPDYDSPKNVGTTAV